MLYHFFMAPTQAPNAIIDLTVNETQIGARYEKLISVDGGFSTAILRAIRFIYMYPKNQSHAQWIEIPYMVHLTSNAGVKQNEGASFGNSILSSDSVPIATPLDFQRFVYRNTVSCLCMMTHSVELDKRNDPKAAKDGDLEAHPEERHYFEMNREYTMIDGSTQFYAFQVELFFTNRLGYPIYRQMPVVEVDVELI